MVISKALIDYEISQEEYTTITIEKMQNTEGRY